MEPRLALAVEPDPKILERLKSAFAAWDIETRHVRLGAELEEALKVPGVRFVVADTKTTDRALDSLLAQLSRLNPQPILVALAPSSDGDVSGWVDRGLFDLLTKPIETTELKLAVRRVVQRQQLLDEVHALRSDLRSREGYHGLVGRSRSMERLREELARLAPLAGPVWLHGEDGCGKKLAARTLHQRSGRGQAAFVELDCESASRDRRFGARLSLGEDGAPAAESIWSGLHGGTLMLSDPGALDKAQQQVLLDSLEQARSAGIDARCVVITERSPESQVEDGRLIGEMAARLAADAIALVPLRERREDIPLLAAHFANAISSINQLSPLRIGRDALQLLESCAWPDNVRGLRNAIERAAIVSSEGTIRAADLPRALGHPSAAPAGMSRSQATAGETFRQAKSKVVEAFELNYLNALMHRHVGNVTAASQESGMLRSALQRLLRKYGLKSSSFRRTRGSKTISEREETHASHS